MLQQLNTAAAKYGTLSIKPLNNPANNYTTNLPFTKTTDSFDIKVDYSREKNHISGRYSYQRVVTFQAAAFGPFLGGPAGGGFEGTGNQNSYSTGINYDHVFSPTFFTEARVGVAHLGNSATNQRLWFQRCNNARNSGREHLRATIHERTSRSHR